MHESVDPWVVVLEPSRRRFTYPPSAGHPSGPFGRRLGKTTSKTHTLATFLAGACKKHVPYHRSSKTRAGGKLLGDVGFEVFNANSHTLWNSHPGSYQASTF